MAVASRGGARRSMIARGLMRRTMLTSGAAITPPSDKTAWQAEHNIDIQRVTQTAMIHELTQQQIATIEKTVPWFLEEMPGASGKMLCLFVDLYTNLHRFLGR